MTEHHAANYKAVKRRKCHSRSQQCFVLIATHSQEGFNQYYGTYLMRPRFYDLVRSLFVSLFGETLIYVGYINKTLREVLQFFRSWAQLLAESEKILGRAHYLYLRVKRGYL